MFWLDIQINGKRFRESLRTSNKKLNEADFLTVQELLRHTTSRVTLGYTHTSMNRKKEAVIASQICHTSRDF